MEPSTTPAGDGNTRDDPGAARRPAAAYPPLSGAPRGAASAPDEDEIREAEEEERVGRLARLPVVVASAVLAGVVLFATLSGKLWYDKREDYKAIARVMRIGNIPMERMPVDPGIYANLAQTYSRDLMPPDNERARAMLGESIQLAPLDSTYWMRVSEQDMLLGQRDKAVAALKVSDALDPRWPVQRLDAVRLWRILGDKARAKDLGVQIARLGLPYREVVSRELLDNGFDTNEVLEAVGFRDQKPEAMASLIRTMAQQPGVSLDVLWKAVPDAARRDGELRQELAKIAEERKRYELLLELWNLESDPAIKLAPGLMVKNADLRRSPLGDSFELGWQPAIEDVTDVHTTWIAPEGLAGSSGRLDVEIGPYAPEQLWWAIYRLVIPADMAVDLGARVSVNPGVRTEAEVRVLVEKEWFSNAKTSGANDRPEDLRHAVPAAPEPRLATIFISWRRAGITDSLTQSKLMVHSVLVRPLPRFSPSTGSGS